MKYFFFFQEVNFKEPVRTFSDEDLENLGLRYYNSDVHRASYVLPQFAKKVSWRAADELVGCSMYRQTS